MSLKVKKIYPFNRKKKIELPLYVSSIKAGFPSPADDYIEKNLDLNEFLIKHPSSTFFLKVEGESMINAGIHSGDILIVDRSLDPKNEKIIIAALDGELTVKRIKKYKNKLYLIPENDKYKPIEITKEMDFSIWGIVTYVIHPVD